MELFEEILRDLDILEEAPRKKLSRKRKMNKKPKKVLRASGKKQDKGSTFQGGFYTQTTLNDEINDAINNMKPVIMKYNSGGENLAMGERTIYPIAYGLSKANNPVVRAFEPKGDTIKGVPAWKFFRVDRIISWDNVDNERFNPNTLHGVNKSGDMLMIKVYNITPFGGGINVDRTSEFIKIGPDAITKQDIETPSGADEKNLNKTYSTDSIINDILKNIQTAQDKTVDNTQSDTYTNNSITNKIDAPETKPITKQDLGDDVIEPKQTDDNIQNSIEQNNEPYKTEPIHKSDLENGNENEEGEDVQPSQENPNNNRFVNFFKNLTKRMNNLYR